TICDAVIKLVIEQKQSWLSAGIDAGRISLNIHASQLKRPETLLEHLSDASFGAVETSDIVLEITEGALIGRGTERIPQLLTDLKAKGFMVSLDDFGTGFASLTHLKALPVDEIKIDRNFVSDLVGGTSGFAILKALVDIADALDLTVIAEGIETIDQAALLTEAGCTRGQGYLFSRPVDARTATRFLKNRVWTTSEETNAPNRLQITKA
ncbi:MAG: EAL domain-containing protein, partial [Pseudomonadota bacterium]